jgi:hypothetical protein
MADVAQPKYINNALLQQFLGNSEALDAGETRRAMLAAEELVRGVTGRNFVADAAATARLFNGNGEQELLINDCVEITKVEVGNNYWGDSFTEVAANSGSNADSYIAMPVNRIDDAGMTWPIRKVMLRSRDWIEGVANHRITAKWGFSAAPPEDIVFAATVLAAGIYKYGNGGSIGNIKSEKIDKYSVTYANEDQWTELNKAMEVLHRYKKFYL